MGFGFLKLCLNHWDEEATFKNKMLSIKLSIHAPVLV